MDGPHLDRGLAPLLCVPSAEDRVSDSSLREEVLMTWRSAQVQGPESPYEFVHTLLAPQAPAPGGSCLPQGVGGGRPRTHSQSVCSWPGSPLCFTDVLLHLPPDRAPKAFILPFHSFIHSSPLQTGISKITVQQTTLTQHRCVYLLVSQSTQVCGDSVVLLRSFRNPGSQVGYLESYKWLHGQEDFYGASSGPTAVEVGEEAGWGRVHPS